MVESSADRQDGTLRVACPACRTVYAIKQALLGKRLKCARCRADWKAIDAPTLEAAGDKVDVIDAQLLGMSGGPHEKVQEVPADLPYDYWLGKKIGRYTVNAILGTGAVGYVYRGHDPELGRDVALKILPKPQGKHMTLRVKLFIQEARAAARLQHPNIVTIHEVGLDGQFYYFAMEVVDGGTLKDLTLALGKLSPPRACFLIAQASQALAYAHELGVIHRDVKPDNLMMDHRGQVKVADFGLAEIGEVDLMKLYRGRPIGTPGYIAPETARGEGATAASDIYCLGLCLYHALTGRKYLTAPNIKDLVTLCAYPPEFQPGAELAGIPGACLRILSRCLQGKPEDRYPNASELADDLRNYVIEAGRDHSHATLPMPGAAGDPQDPRGLWPVSRYLKKRKPSKN